MIAALADFGVEAGLIDGLTGVWVGAEPPPAGDARKIGSIGIHVSRGITTHGLAVNVNNDLQPFEWIVPCGIEACRMTSLTRELGAEQDVDEFATALAARLGEVYEREPVETPADEVLGSLTFERGMSREPPERIHVTRSRANPGGATGIEGRPFRERKPPWLKVPAPGRPDLPQAEAVDRGRQPAHGLRGGELPQRRRVLGARHGDVHDPRRRLHPPLRLLQRADRACRPGTTRSSRCGSRPR